MIYIKQIDDQLKIAKEDTRNISVKSLIRLHGLQTETKEKRRIMGNLTVLLTRRIREFNLKLTFKWFSRHFINKDVIIDFAPADIHIFLEYDDWTAFAIFKKSILQSVGSCCNYAEVKQGMILYDRKIGSLEEHGADKIAE